MLEIDFKIEPKCVDVIDKDLRNMLCPLGLGSMFTKEDREALNSDVREHLEG